MPPLITDLQLIKELAEKQENENDHFQSFLLKQNQVDTDKAVHQLNETISSQVDCTKCGNCCRSLMINITVEEIQSLATHLQLSLPEAKEKYIEESEGGLMIINTIPCHFLADNRCTIYTHRFTECRDFPHLYKPNFTKRLFATMMYYSMCPIIFNVIETLKENLGFKIVQISRIESDLDT